MDTFVTKTAQAIALYQAGNVRAALKIAKGFRLGLTEEDRVDLARAYECMINPEFYLALDFVIPFVIAKGKAVFEHKIMPKPDPVAVLEDWLSEMSHTPNYDEVMGG